MNQDVFSTARAARTTVEDQRALAGETIRSFERLATRQGERRVLTTKSPLRDLDGKLIGMLCVMRDVSDTPEGEHAPQGHEPAERSHSG
jgi:PAS domain-containing protein